jgi:hypothetical protein
MAFEIARCRGTVTRSFWHVTYKNTMSLPRETHLALPRSRPSAHCREILHHRPHICPPQTVLIIYISLYPERARARARSRPTSLSSAHCPKILILPFNSRLFDCYDVKFIFFRLYNLSSFYDYFSARIGTWECTVERPVRVTCKRCAIRVFL